KISIHRPSDQLLRCSISVFINRSSQNHIFDTCFQPNILSRILNNICNCIC
ncbi:hypothetical protein HK096_003693, partial [Nowakowskiella sp. JEL0078]